MKENWNIWTPTPCALFFSAQGTFWNFLRIHINKLLQVTITFMYFKFPLLKVWTIFLSWYPKWVRMVSLDSFIMIYQADLIVWVTVSLNCCFLDSCMDELTYYKMTVPRRWVVPLLMCRADTGDKVQRKVVLSNLQNVTTMSMKLHNWSCLM